MGFSPPPYPFERIDASRRLAARFDPVVDLAIGTPCDPPPPAVIAALGGSNAERGYPTSLGSPSMREAAAGWLSRRLGATVDPATQVASCIGTKEFVGTTPQYLRLRTPERDTVLYPAVSYPTYEMGAILAGCRAVPVPVDAQWRMQLDAIDPSDIARALCIWSNTPSNPTGGLDDLGLIAEWGRRHGVPVLSDECYVEFTWDGPAQTILTHGTEGVLAVHSLSKRSNLAGVRAGFYAGDRELVRYLSEVRKHAGFMVPGPVQAAATVAYNDDAHVDAQRTIYRRRLEMFAGVLGSIGLSAPLPGGGFYLWVPVPGGDAWACTAWLAEQAGVIATPGEFYGSQSHGYIRFALVEPDELLELAAKRFAESGAMWSA